MKGPLVLGIGNVLMGDEGIGVHVVRRLEGTLPPHVTLLDGGTGGFNLLSELIEHDPIFMIDATMDEQPAGTVSVIEPRYLSDFPRTLTAHDIGLRDLVEAAQLLGRLPRIHLVTVSVDTLQPMEVSLSPAIEAAIPEVVDRIRDLIAVHGEHLRSN
ncbi:MAG: hydrogenase maturation protease [Betaproteobacteria bacterium]